MDNKEFKELEKRVDKLEFRCDLYRGFLISICIFLVGVFLTLRGMIIYLS